MVATNKYADYVIEAVKAGADIIISGAGLPIELPELVAKGQALSENAKKTCIAPIVSSRKSAKVILKMWDRKYNTTADAVVIEGPLAGGHLGFSYDELHELGADTMASKNYKREKYDAEIKEIIEEVRIYEEKFGKKIPVFVAGGIYTREDMEHAMSLGADGVQMGTRFVTTYECDAPDDYKQTYIDAKEEDIVITKSPVGMPGRAIRNDFMDRLKSGPVPIRHCCNCLATSVCDRKTIPYCITEALCCAANSDESHALLFCGANAYRAKKIEHVADIINELTENQKEIAKELETLEKEKIETEKQIAEKTRYIQRIPKYVGGTLMWPVPSANSTKWITAFYGAGASQGYPGSSHSGVDIAIPRGEVRKT